MTASSHRRRPPWLELPPEASVSAPQVREWVTLGAAASVGGPPDSAGLAPGVSVVVPAHSARDHLADCLDSLVGQTLSPDQWEAIVVLNGPEDGSFTLVEDVRREHPGVSIRTVRLPWEGASAARNAGLRTCARRHVTFLDADDRISPGYLEGLLRNAAPGVVPVARVIDVDETSGEHSASYMETSLGPRRGQFVPLLDVQVVSSYNAGKLLPTALARAVEYDEGLRSGEDVVFMTTVLGLVAPLVYVADDDEDVFYLRTVRGNSLSRPGTSIDFNVAQRLEVIQRLVRLRPHLPEDMRELVRRKVGIQSTFMVEWASEHRDRHDEFVATLDAHPVIGLPYSRINADAAEDLAVGYAFPPTTDTSAVVAGKRIRQRGRIVDVVRNPLEGIRTEDESLRLISGPYTAREHVIASRASFMTWRTMAEFAGEGLDRVLTTRSRPYRSVYSRAHFAASHLLAAMYKVRHPETPWVAEFSDPLSRDIHGEVRPSGIDDERPLEGIRTALADRGFTELAGDNAMEWCEWMAYGLADEIIFTNDNQRDYMLSYAPHELARRAGEVATVSPHPTLPEAFYSMVPSSYPLDDGVANVGYFGNFYATRGLDEVLRALADASSAGTAVIRLHVFTSKMAELRETCRQAGVKDLVSVRPYVPFLEFLNLTTRFDALLVNDAATGDSHAANPYLPSKWSDYRGSGVGVWGIVEPGSPLSKMPLAWRSELFDHAGAVAALRDIAVVAERRRGATLNAASGSVVAG